MSTRRGNALLVTMIALAVLMVLVVGAIRFTGTNQVAAVSKMRGDRLAACADTARRYLISRLRVNQAATAVVLDPATGQNYRNLPDDAVSSRQSIIGAGHYDDNLLSLSQPHISVVPSSSFGASGMQARDLSNVMPTQTGIGGQYYRVVMKCQEPGTLGTARASEIEFIIRFGL